MTDINHVMISASAGSGKTYQLTTRYVALLARGQAPNRIVALTFTKKAAGEFFDEIIKKLASATKSKEDAAKLAVAIGMPEMKCDDFSRLLKLFIDYIPQLRLGTMDSFFASIVKAFPLELGLSGDFELLQDHGAQLERRRVLEQMYTNASEENKNAQKDFIESYKRATFGTEEKRLEQRLDQFIDQYYQVYLDIPDQKAWGNAKAIWQDQHILSVDEKKCDLAIKDLEDWVANNVSKDKVKEKWLSFIQAVKTWNPGAPIPKDIESMIERCSDQWSLIHEKNFELKFWRDVYTLDKKSSEALYLILKRIISLELKRKLEITQGIYSILRNYDDIYRRGVRSKGKLTFSDVQRILDPKLFSSYETSQDRLLIDYRLDGRIDHWLLDEFQDTSFSQWEIFKNLIDEVVQDTSAQRSFFCVGDVKQAIYAWRKGDPRLFDEILNGYNRASDDIIKEERLFESRRSSPAVISAVNKVFGSSTKWESLFPLQAVAAWRKAWEDHKAYNQDEPGYTCLAVASDSEHRKKLCLQLLQEIKPLERGLTCAILVQKNEYASELADYLRQQGGIPAVAESDLNVCVDNPVGLALLAMAKVAVHPGDTLAWGHITMTPIYSLLEAKKLTQPFQFSEYFLNQIYTQGFERTYEYWILLLESFLSTSDGFSRMRARQFLNAASQVDQLKTRNIDEFIDFMQRYVLRDTETESTVRIMTIHKSKGLGFGVVILPDLEGDSIAQRRDGLAVHETESRSVEWVLDLPSKFIYELDPVLKNHVEFETAEACYEKLSLLYVAMTRAKYASYIIVEPQPKDSKSNNFKKLLAVTLGEQASDLVSGNLTYSGTYSCGDSNWFKRYDKEKDNSSGLGKLPVLDALNLKAVIRHESQKPSADLSLSVSAASLFESESALEYGTLVHRLFSSVGWIDELTLVNCSKNWAQYGKAAEEVISCLKEPNLKTVWATTKPELNEVWTEKAFEVLIEDKWISGIIDRVIVTRDESRTIIEVKVYDFKTDIVASSEDLQHLAKHYKSQMTLYRKAISVLLNVDIKQVKGYLLFTKALTLEPIQFVV